MIVIYWLIAAAVFVVLEIVTMGLTTVWFAGGALVGALAAGFSLPIWVQILAFILVSLFLLFLTRPIAMKYVNNKTVKTNADDLVGKVCIVTESIDNLKAKGQVTVKGQVWTARSISDDMNIAEQTKVTIEAISGVKLIVRPME